MEKQQLEIFRDKSICVTGGTGSFGHQIAEVLVKSDFKEVRIFSRDEQKQEEMEREFPDERFTFIVGDVRDLCRLREATRNIDILYHAAALKIIPSCEKHPVEALKTNVIGSINVKKAAIENGIEKTFLISTDKAVKPVNTYGMCKALAEKIFANNQFANDDTKFGVIRYGNIVGSRGSVVPLFRKLIEKQRPLPITDPEMTRFWLTLREALSLVIFATEKVQDGEIYVPIISACKVIDLARVMAGRSYPTKIIGIRPGEKIHECLVQEDEMRRVEEKEGCYVIRPYRGGLPSRVGGEEFSSDRARRLSDEEISKLLIEAGFS